MWRRMSPNGLVRAVSISANLVELARYGIFMKPFKHRAKQFRK